MNNDLIRRGELAEEIKSLRVFVTGLRAGKGVLAEYALQFRDSVLRIIDEQPAVDAVEVVRCRDCKNWNYIDHLGCTEFVKLCKWGGYMVGANGYCVYGERREDDA